MSIYQAWWAGFLGLGDGVRCISWRYFKIGLLETGNGTESATLAGYSERSAAAASCLLRNPEIKGRLDAELLRQAEMYGISVPRSRGNPGHRRRQRGQARRQASGLGTVGQSISGYSTEKVEQDSKITVIVERIGG